MLYGMTILKIIIISVVTICSSFIAAELYLKKQVPNNLQQLEVEPMNQPDAELGFSGIPDFQGKAAMKENGQYVYQTRIHLNHWGFRFPDALKKQTQRESCILIFGDSMAFGTGVQDNETVAAILQKNLKNSRVYNFSFHAYGPHHALRLIEIGRMKEFLEGCSKIKSYYFSQMHHVKRVAGHWPLALNAPKYGLVNNILTYQGPLYPQWFELFHRKYISQWKTLNSIFNYFMAVDAGYSEKEIELYKLIVVKMQTLLRERYHSSLTIVMFDFGALPSMYSTKQLEIKNIPTIYFDEWAAKKIGLNNIRREFYIKDDSHINKFGHKFLAHTILTNDLSDWK